MDIMIVGMLVHWDGNVFTAVPLPSEAGSAIQDIWGSGDGEMLFSGEWLYFDGTDFVRSSNRILGRIDGRSANDVAAVGVQGMSSYGALYNGTEWVSLEMGVLTDIVMMADGAVVGLGIDGKVEHWENNVSDTVRLPICSGFRHLAADAAGNIVAFCFENQGFGWQDNAWVRLPGVEKGPVVSGCFVGNTFTGISQQGPDTWIWGYADGESFVVEAASPISRIMTCNSSVATFVTADLRFIELDGATLKEIADWPSEDGIIDQIVRDDAGTIYATMSLNSQGYLLRYADGEWQRMRMPFEAISLGLFSDGTVMASSADDATVMEFQCGDAIW